MSPLDERKLELTKKIADLTPAELAQFIELCKEKFGDDFLKGRPQ